MRASENNQMIQVLYICVYVIINIDDISIDIDTRSSH